MESTNQTQTAASTTHPIYDVQVAALDGGLRNLRTYHGQVLLVVNTATECGLVGQFAGLQALHEAYQARGFTVLGFPCNQFRNQEPRQGEAIGAFCQKNYGVNFPMFDRIEVNGPGTHPLFKHLKAEAPGLLGSQGIKWNFTKFLVDREGRVVSRFAPTERPEKLKKAVEALL